ncbi:leucine-rich repeat receptor-like protein kinase TDR [Prosopis cineraria]|uniref:leucine-rich repeat receptor-like protein kinase TDR n=1 Tax=Prosopis cineraria TaxID=364024 RepID=UPI002410A992|nr:leucine-rich repeat receptor-like protein kinase TDR [Prosopis cineraria]
MKPPPFSSSSLFPLTFFFFFCHIQLLVFSATPSAIVSLLSLKSSLIDPHNTLHDWNYSSSSQDPSVWCSWSGIMCHPRTSQIITIDLSQRNLSGLISPQIRFLTTLNHLNLSWNDFTGIFPPAIFELSELRTLDINHNYFNSSFPPGISRLKFLRVFNAYSNNFVGPLPQEFMRLRFLERLNLGGSYFNGTIPSGYGNLPRLKSLYLAGNLLEGPIPFQLGFLSELERLEIGYNQFSGGLPEEFALLSSLKYLDIASSNISGSLIHDLGNMTMLETLLLYKNQLVGEIPSSLGNLESLNALDLSDNKLSGSIPEEISMLKELTILSLMSNKLTGEIPQGIGDLPKLETLLLWNNSLSGILPQTLGSNGLLQKLDVSTNSLTGPIPPNVCNGSKLIKLILFNNEFEGAFPESFTKCTSLLRLRIQNNRLNGSIPEGFSLLPNLAFVDMSNNNFTGRIPEDFGDAPSLQNLNISGNSFENPLPSNIWNAKNLLVFSAISSKINGQIPDFIGCKSIYRIELQGNFINGSIPWSIENCERLIVLNLSRNSLSGIIPWEISALPSITDVDLSHNFLSGTIPSGFNNCTTLENFNVSFNSLTGPIPSAGSIFSNLNPSSFSGNDGLCGGVLAKPCAMDTPSPSTEQQHDHPRKTTGAVVWIVAAAVAVGLFALVAGTRCFRSHHSGPFMNNREIGPWKLTAFQRLNFTAEDVVECMTVSNKIIGMGSTGTVFKVEMPSGDIIAVKKLWGKQKESSNCIRRRRGVLAEVDVLGNVRHRNIVRLLACCSNRESTMLLYEYMPNGNLEDLLHGKNVVGDWLTRYKIALGVAQGICYLHHDCNPVIVHRDLKPSNILLDAEMEARVADFGVAKLIQSDESMSVIAGSYGYIAPEYAYTLQVDEKSDIYSYGVVLLEILCGRRSVNAEFGEGNSIVDWVKSKIKTKNGINDILDKNIGAGCAPVRDEMMQMLRIALLCTSRNPADRPSMRDVVLMLQEAKPKRKMFDNIVLGQCGDKDIGSGEDDDIVLPQKAKVEI